MSDDCGKIQLQLLDGNVDEVDVQEHLHVCSGCHQLAASLSLLDSSTEQLSSYSPSPEVVTHLLKQVRVREAAPESTLARIVSLLASASGWLLSIFLLSILVLAAWLDDAIEILSSLIVSSLGTTLMLVAFALAIVTFFKEVMKRSKRSFAYRYFPTTGLLTAAIALFALRSMTSNFFPADGLQYQGHQANDGAILSPYESLLGALKEDVSSISTRPIPHEPSPVTTEDKKKEKDEKMSGVLEMVTERLENQEDSIRDLEKSERFAQLQATAKAGQQLQNLARQFNGVRFESSTSLSKAPTELISNLLAQNQRALRESRNFVSPGDSVSVKLLTGVAAPVDGTPYPVLFKLLGSIKGPDGALIDLGNARLLASAQGSESDGRVTFRLSELAYQDKDGNTVRTPIDGWIVGEDGVRGMRGRNVEKHGAVIAATAGKSLIDVNQIDSNDKNANSIGQLLVDKRDVMLPVVEVNANREVAAIFSKGTEISELGAESFLNRSLIEQRRETVNLTFIDPQGYWANTYLPGDPETKLLEASFPTNELGSLARHLLPGVNSISLVQPFDVPKGAALGLQVHGDKLTANGETRMLVQVGLQGALRDGAIRAPLRLAVILDTAKGTLNTEQQMKVRAILSALLSSKNPSDAFALFIADPTKAESVAASDFRSGTVEVALDKAFGIRPTAVSAQTMNEALNSASLLTVGEKALEQSRIIVISAAEIQDSSALETVKRIASAGTSVSTISIGSLSPQSSDSFALAGQGERYLVSTPADAQSVISRELTAAARTVARALRLRIKLAPGVKLVEIVGSEKLQVEQAAEARKTELELDRRVAKELGIDSDRSEEDDGIQILIPAFLAGDSHVILLDVVAPGSGAVLEASVQYKDLIGMKNEKIVTSFALANEGLIARTSPATALVLRNYLAQELALSLREAASKAEGGNISAGQQILNEAINALRSVQESEPFLKTDPAVTRDVEFLTGLSQLFASGPDRSLMIQAARIAAARKLHAVSKDS